MGCHILDPAFWSLKLGNPTSVEANVSYNPDMQIWESIVNGRKNWKEAIEQNIDAMRKESVPAASIIRYEFPERDGFPPLKLTWYDGGLLPSIPEVCKSVKKIGGSGAFIIGENGVIQHGSHGAGGLRLHPDSLMEKFTNEKPPQLIERVPGHYQDWINACKTGKPSSSNFDYGGALTEMVLLGVVAMRVPGEKLFWDQKQMAFINNDQANEFVKSAFREGWKM
jgi:hypothetical protein